MAREFETFVLLRPSLLGTFGKPCIYNGHFVLSLCQPIDLVVIKEGTCIHKVFNDTEWRDRVNTHSSCLVYIRRGEKTFLASPFFLTSNKLSLLRQEIALSLLKLRDVRKRDTWEILFFSFLNCWSLQEITGLQSLR